MTASLGIKNRFPTTVHNRYVETVFLKHKIEDLKRLASTAKAVGKPPEKGMLLIDTAFVRRMCREEKERYDKEGVLPLGLKAKEALAKGKKKSQTKEEYIHERSQMLDEHFINVAKEINKK